MNNKKCKVPDESNYAGNPKASMDTFQIANQDLRGSQKTTLYGQFRKNSVYSYGQSTSDEGSDEEARMMSRGGY